MCFLFHLPTCENKEDYKNTSASTMSKHPISRSFPFERLEIKPMNPKCIKSPPHVPEMDPGIWSRLPAEVLEHILSLLPLKSFLSLRSTCKQFKSLIYSPPFISRHSCCSSPFASFLLLSHSQFNRNFPIYDSVIGTWRDVGLSLPLLMSSSVADLPSSSLVSSSNGMLCFSVPSLNSFIVCNSLAKSSRVIEFPAYPFAFEALTFVSTPLGYKIFMLYGKLSSNFALVYDSRTLSWKEYDGFEPILSHSNHQEGVVFNGSLYFTTPEPFLIVSFDLEDGKWENSNKELPRELTFARLVSDGGKKMYLIGGVGRNGISKLMKLWELGEEGKWIEIESLPEMMCRKFMCACYHNYEHVYCFWHQGMICVCCYTWPEILYYKVSRRTWHWVPKCPSLSEKWSCGFKWFSFVPELYASV